MTARKKTIALIFAGLLLLLIFLPTQNPKHVDPLHALEAPSAAHWLGTDPLGRDVFARLSCGCARTLTVVGVATLVSLGIGAALGVSAGYFGGLYATAVQCLSDFMLIVPTFIVALVLLSVLGFSPLNAGLVLGLCGSASYTQQLTVLTRGMKNAGFIRAERVVGLSTARILFFHLLPNLKNALLTFMAGQATGVVMTYAGLAFIGLGNDVTNPDWGSMIYEYRLYATRAPMLVLWPTLGVFALSLCLQLLFDNPTLKGRVNRFERR